MRILRDPAAAPAGGGATDWTATLPPELKPVVQTKGWKSPVDVVTSYANLEKTLGQDKIPAPQKTWTDKEWSDFYNRIGRPEAADKYEIPSDVKLNEGITLSDEKLKTAKETFHKLGLTSKQASEIMRFYLGTVNESDTALRSSRQAQIDQGMRKLQEEFGDKHQAQIDLARSVVAKFGGDELVNYLNESGLGNHPALIKAFAKIGSGVLEDTIKGAGGELGITDSTRAGAEIGRMKMDKDFMEALQTANHPGHQAAVDRWLAVHKMAFPAKEE